MSINKAGNTKSKTVRAINQPSNRLIDNEPTPSAAVWAETKIKKQNALSPRHRLLRPPRPAVNL